MAEPSLTNHSSNMSTVNSWEENSAWKAYILYHRMVSIVIGLAIVVGNSITLTCFRKYEFLRVRKNVLVCSLSAADLLVGASFCALIMRYTLAPHLCKASPISMTVLLSFIYAIYASSANLVVISLDRFVAIMFPLRYPTLVTEKTLRLFVALSWSLPLLFLLLNLLWLIWAPSDCKTPFMPDSARSAMVLVMYFTISVTLCFVYGKILFVARQQKQKELDLQILKKTDTITQHGQPSTHQQPYGNSKATKAVMLLLSAYIILYLPYIASLCLLVNGFDDSMFYQILSNTGQEFVLVTSCINVFVYATIAKDFQRAYRLLCCCKSVVEPVENWNNSITTTETV